MIEFWDHCKGHDAPMLSQVVGWVLKDEPEFFMLTYWRIIDAGEEIFRDNLEPFVIVKTCITKKRVIK